MDASPVRVLLVEDDDDDYFLTQDLLAEAQPGGYELDRAATYADALAAMCSNGHEIYLLDYRLGERTGVELLREAFAHGCRRPAILLTGEGERSVDLEAMKAGAADFLAKAKLDAPTLERSIRYALQHWRDQEALRQAHDELERRVEERTADLAKANEALREADQRKDEFLAMLAHELRNPLAPIRNAVQLLALAGRDGETLRRAREMIERQVKHMVRLVDDLLDVSRITRGLINLRREPLDLAAVVAVAVEGGRHLIDARGQDLQVALPAEPVPVEGDPTRLTQVLTNLLSNAAKYTPDRGRIRLTVARDGAEALVCVRDEGVGIPADLLPRVFDLFTQAERGLDRSQGGLGIGLTLVKKLVDLHGGTVAAHSDGPGRGAEFAVRLPLAANAPTDNGQSSNHAAPPARRRVLVVDDNVDSAESLAAVLRLTGNDARTAHDPFTAIDAAAAYKPDLVLLDIGLPGMTGYEVAQRLRSRPDLAHAVLVAMTGYGGDTDRRRSEECGFHAHLVKPVDHDELATLLAGLQPAHA